MRSSGSRLLAATGAITAGAAAAAFTAYRKELNAAAQRLEGRSQVIDSVHGPIEFGESGDGPPVLVIHGAGGGFDQGLDLGRVFLGNHRIVAPSRFGYLGTPMPADPSPEAQADAHVHVLDALGLDRVPVIAISAGGPSAMQFCLRHPERCSALVLIVAMTYLPGRELAATPSPFFAGVLNAITASDVLFWTAMKVAHSTLLKTILGTPVEVYRSATADERRGVDEMLRSILPISRRAAGIWNDATVSNNLTRYQLEEIRVPTLVISATDDGYHTYESSRYTAEQIPGAKFLGFPSGGHLLVGHDAEVRAQVTSFLKESVEAEKTTAAMAV
jgi:2-hydroxy-6-oxonona-2,4-dienedioate hydrolase